MTFLWKKAEKASHGKTAVTNVSCAALKFVLLVESAYRMLIFKRETRSRQGRRKKLSRKRRKKKLRRIGRNSLWINSNRQKTNPRKKVHNESLCIQIYVFLEVTSTEPVPKRTHG